MWLYIWTLGLSAEPTSSPLRTWSQYQHRRWSVWLQYVFIETFGLTCDPLENLALILLFLQYRLYYDHKYANECHLAISETAWSGWLSIRPTASLEMFCFFSVSLIQEWLQLSLQLLIITSVIWYNNIWDRSYLAWLESFSCYLQLTSFGIGKPVINEACMNVDAILRDKPTSLAPLGLRSSTIGRYLYRTIPWQGLKSRMSLFVCERWPAPNMYKETLSLPCNYTESDQDLIKP